jgi:diamine N-acetyltransferase
MLHGERVVLRAIERDDLPNYVRWLNDKAVLRYFGFYRPMSLADEEHWYEGTLGNAAMCVFAVEYEGRHVGGAGLDHIDGKNASAEVGLFIGEPKLWDKGLGGDILRTLVHYGFEQLNLNRIYLRVFADNERAVHLYEKMGFQHEGRWREHEFRHGHYHDLLWMSVLRREWAD